MEYKIRTVVRLYCAGSLSVERLDEIRRAGLEETET